MSYGDEARIVERHPVRKEKKRTTLPPDVTGIMTVIPPLVGPVLLRLGVFFTELVDTAFGIDELLFTGEEGVADRADVEPDNRFGGPGLVCLATGAVDLRQLVVRVNSLFHGSTPPDC